MANTYRPEPLFDENAYFCSKCDRKQNAHKGLIPTKVGKYVSVYVNRFSFDLHTLQRIKLQKEVQIPLKLSLGQYMKESATAEDYDFELFGIIVHRGTPYSGHYFLVANDIANQASQDTPSFYELNDTIVNKVPDNYFQKFVGNTDQSAYLLIYRRMSLDEDFSSYKLQINSDDAVYTEILHRNEIITQQRNYYQSMKSCVKIKFGLFDLLTSVDLLAASQPDRLLQESIPEEFFIEMTLNKQDVGALLEDAKNDFGLLLEDFDCYQVIAKSGRVLYYKRKIDFSYLVGLPEEQVDISFGATFVLVDKLSAQNLPFFANFTSQNVR